MGSSLIKAGRKTKDFIEQMEGLIRLCSAKKINIRPGTSAKTDGISTIYLPWLPNDATDEQVLKFFGFAAHEQAHFYGNSVVKEMSGNKSPRNMTRHNFENAVDDIRCENLQEQEYPGLKEYRKQFYRLIYAENLHEHMATATRSNLLKFLHAVMCYLISTVRYEQLGMDDEIEASPEVIDAYNKYVKDLVPRVKAQRTFKQALELGGLIYDRMKDLIREEMEKRTPPPPKPEPKEPKDDTDEDRSADGGSPAEDSGEGSDEESPADSGDDSVRDDKPGESSEPEDEREDAEPSGEDADSETEECPDREGDSEDQGGEGGSDKDMDDPEESDSPGDGESEESGDGRAEDSAGASGESSTDAPESSDSSDEPGRPGGHPEDGDSPDGVDDSEEPDPFGEHEKAMHEWEETIIEAVKKALEDIEEHADELKSITEEVAEDINALADSADAPYMVHEGVRDRIGYKEEGPLHIAEEYRDQGIKLLGSAGSRMTRLFVGLNRPKNLHNRFEGRFDMRSFTADALDRRTDVYNQKIQPRIDKAAVSFMIDNSGSMGGTPIQRTYQMLSAMLMYLSRAMIPTEAVGFTADTAYSYRYRDCPVYLQIVKQFDDPYDRKVLQRCVPPEFMSQNAEVDCLRWMVPRLYARPEKKKILFILGDGEPCIGNYALNAKLAAAYREYIGLCRQAGIIVFGFGIKCNLSWIFGEDFISVDSYDMGDKILDKLTEVLNRPNHTTLERAAA